METILNKDQRHILEIIYKVYNRTSTGCKSIGIVANKRDLDFLIEKDLIFHTANGYFPSTKGQELINFN